MRRQFPAETVEIEPGCVGADLSPRDSARPRLAAALGASAPARTSLSARYRGSTRQRRLNRARVASRTLSCNGSRERGAGFQPARRLVNRKLDDQGVRPSREP